MATKSKPAAKSKTKQTIEQRFAKDPKLKAKYLSNPGLRSKLPDKFLSPDQLKTRQTNTYNKAPITEGSTVTRGALNTEADAATAQRYGGQEQTLATQGAQAAALTRDTAGWYDQYKAELAQHAANTNAINAAAQQQTTQLAGGMRALDQTNANASQAAAAQDAAGRGATADPTAAATASNASQVRQQMLASFGTAQAGVGAAASRYADNQANVVGPGQKLRALGQATQGQRDVADRALALQAEKGAYGQDYRNKRTTEEANYVLAKSTLAGNQQNMSIDNALAAKTAKTSARNAHDSLALRRQTAATSDANTKAGLAIRREEAATAKAAAKARATAKAKAKKPVSGPGSLTPAKEQDLLRKSRVVLQRLQHPTTEKTDPLTGVKKLVPATKAQALNDLIAGDTDPDLLILARSLDHYHGKGIGPRGVAAAHRLGIHVGPNWKIIKTPTSTIGKLKPIPGAKLPASKGKVSKTPPVKLG